MTAYVLYMYDTIRHLQPNTLKLTAFLVLLFHLWILLLLLLCIFQAHCHIDYP